MRIGIIWEKKHKVFSSKKYDFYRIFIEKENVINLS